LLNECGNVLDELGKDMIDLPLIQAAHPLME
jgi:hypothetical protein